MGKTHSLYLFIELILLPLFVYGLILIPLFVNALILLPIYSWINPILFKPICSWINPAPYLYIQLFYDHRLILVPLFVPSILHTYIHLAYKWLFYLTQNLVYTPLPVVLISIFLNTYWKLTLVSRSNVTKATSCKIESWKCFQYKQKSFLQLHFSRLSDKQTLKKRLTFISANGCHSPSMNPS